MNAEYNLENKKIVVFGATSKIASGLVVRALEQKAKVIAFVRSESKAAPLARLGAEIVVGDITNPRDVSSAVPEEADATFNFAADFNLSEDASRSYPVNVIGESNVVAASLRRGVRHHTLISTTGVRIEGPNGYKDTKLRAEELVRNSGLSRWTILRYTNVIGTPDLNDLWNRPFLVLNLFHRRLGLTIAADKNAPFSFLSVDSAIEAAISTLSASPNQTITVVDGITTLEEYLSQSAKKNHIDYRIGIQGELLAKTVAGLNRVARMGGRYFPITAGAVRVLYQPPDFDNKIMVEELGVIPRTLEQAMAPHL